MYIAGWDMPDVSSKIVHEHASPARADMTAIGDVIQDNPESLHDEEFCLRLETLGNWKRQHMPVLNMPQGAEVLVWLLKGSTRIRPLKDLYRGSRFSEPTVRCVLKALVDDGFVSIERSPDDMRVRIVRVSPKLVATVYDYLRLLRSCAVASYGWEAAA